MVDGLIKFREHFSGLEDCFILIGGVACELWMRQNDLPFRTTRDIDLVLVLEALRADFFRCFWAFVKQAQYESMQQSKSRPQFYRFKGPSRNNYPYMIELLTRNVLDLPISVHLSPIPSGEDVSSLSAILLDDNYYQFVVDSKELADGMPIVPAFVLIPLKARAYLDLTRRKQGGDRGVKGDDIKKHRNDVFLLSQALAADAKYELPGVLRADLTEFLNALPPGSRDWRAISASVRDILGAAYSVDPSEAIRQLTAIFQLDG